MKVATGASVVFFRQQQKDRRPIPQSKKANLLFCSLSELTIIAQVPQPQRRCWRPPPARARIQHLSLQYLLLLARISRVFIQLPTSYKGSSKRRHKKILLPVSTPFPKQQSPGHRVRKRGMAEKKDPKASPATGVSLSCCSQAGHRLWVVIPREPD